MSKFFLAAVRRSRISLHLLLVTVTVLGGFAGSSHAQAIPGVPGIPATPTPPGAAGLGATSATGATAPAAPSNLWSFLCPTPDQKAACQAKLCALPITQLLNNMMMPVSLFSGGLFSGCCPTGPSAAALAAPPDSPDGAAARIQQSEAEAKKRRLTIRYLGTVDCRYWPEAEAALVTALRSDPNECVRYEAALAMTTGCCCTKAIIDALVLCVSGSTKDHHPAEMSPRVRHQAHIALEHCLGRYTQVVAAPEANERPEKPERPMPERLIPAPTLGAPRTLPAVSAPPPAALPALPVLDAQNAGAPGSAVPPSGQRSLYEVLTRATPSAAPPLAETTAAPAAPVALPKPSTGHDLFSIVRKSVASGS